MKLMELILAVSAMGALACNSDETPAGPTESNGPSLSTAAVYTRRDLGTLGGQNSEATDINAIGIIVGASQVASGFFHAFRWQNGVMTDLGTLGGASSSAEAINVDGVIVGWSETKSGVMRAARWRNGNLRSLGTLGGPNSQATGISPLGVITGWSETSSGNRHAFIWKDGVMKDIGVGTLGNPFSSATGINRGEVAVGWLFRNGENHAFRYKNGLMLDLGTFGRLSSVANAINNAGVVVGLLGPFPDAQGEDLEFTTPFRWYQGTFTDLKISWGIATDINPDGVITGYSEIPGDPPRGEAWVWQNGVTTMLPEPTNAPALSRGMAINPHADVVGFLEPNCVQEVGCDPRHATLWKHN
jgi:probable HAF family extracellular repeat protein